MAEPLAHLTEAIPAEVVLYQEDLGSSRFTPRELDLIREHFGRSFSEIVTDEKTDDKFVVLGWLKLRRSGYGLTFDQLRDVVITTKPTESALDPTDGEPSASSPPSAIGGE